MFSSSGVTTAGVATSHPHLHLHLHLHHRPPPPPPTFVSSFLSSSYIPRAVHDVQHYNTVTESNGLVAQDRVIPLRCCVPPATGAELEELHEIMRQNAHQLETAQSHDQSHSGSGYVSSTADSEVDTVADTGAEGGAEGVTEVDRVDRWDLRIDAVRPDLRKLAATYLLGFPYPSLQGGNLAGMVPAAATAAATVTTSQHRATTTSSRSGSSSSAISMTIAASVFVPSISLATSEGANEGPAVAMDSAEYRRLQWSKNEVSTLCLAARRWVIVPTVLLESQTNSMSVSCMHVTIFLLFTDPFFFIFSQCTQWILWSTSLNGDFIGMGIMYLAFGDPAMLKNLRSVLMMRKATKTTKTTKATKRITMRMMMVPRRR